MTATQTTADAAPAAAALIVACWCCANFCPCINFCDASISAVAPNVCICMLWNYIYFIMSPMFLLQHLVAAAASCRCCILLSLQLTQLPLLLPWAYIRRRSSSCFPGWSNIFHVISTLIATVFHPLGVPRPGKLQVSLVYFWPRETETRQMGGRRTPWRQQRWMLSRMWRHWTFIVGGSPACMQ